MSDETINFLFDQGNHFLDLISKTDIEEAQIVLNKSLELGTRFGENHITQNGMTDTTELFLTLVKNNQIGKIIVNLPKPDEYQQIIDNALTILKFSEPDSDFPGFIRKSSNNPEFQTKSEENNIEKVADSIQSIAY